MRVLLQLWPIPFEPATDGHAHLLLPRLLRAIQEAITEAAGWEFEPPPVDPAAIESALVDAGIDRDFALLYTHAPGVTADHPILFHAGTAPIYEDSPHVGVKHFRVFFESYPGVRACSAHMGAFETEAFFDVLRDHESAFLDTPFVMSTGAPADLAFEPSSVPDAVFEEFAGRVMYTSKFPNVPHPYHERTDLLDRDLSAAAIDALFRGTADSLLGADE